MNYVYIIGGAVIGAPLRYFLQGRVQELYGIGFPAGTLAVNLTGCFVIGLLATLAEERDLLTRDARLFLLVGLIGSYTTFSTFGWETVELLRDNQPMRAAVNVLVSTVGGLFAVWAGMAAARTI